MKIGPPASEIHETRNGLAYCGGSVGASRRAIVFGVLSENGELAPYGTFKTTFGRSIWPKEVSQSTQAAIEIAGSALFSGFVNGMFGHLITSGLGRIWATDDLPDDTTLHYLAPPHLEKRFPDIEKMMGRINALFGKSNPVCVTSGSVQADRYFTAQDRYGEAFLGGADVNFVSWVHKRLSHYRNKPIVPGRRLFVSREDMPNNAGRIACESHLAHNLERDGYERFSPEKHSLEEQALRYAQAEHLIFSEGSAMHLYAFIKKPEQKVAILQRRQTVSRMITRQFYAFDPQPAHFLNLIERQIYPAVLQTNQQIAVLDFDTCRKALALFGFIPEATDWVIPTAEEIEASVRQGHENRRTFETEEEWSEWRQGVRKKKQARRDRREAARAQGEPATLGPDNRP